jgi:hypothetical protein
MKFEIVNATSSPQPSKPKKVSLNYWGSGVELQVDGFVLFSLYENGTARPILNGFEITGIKLLEGSN